MTLFPDDIDNFTSIPLIVDGASPIRAEGINNLRSALISIENELGTNPSGIYGNVADRLSSLSGGSGLDSLFSIKGELLSFDGDVLDVLAPSATDGYLLTAASGEDVGYKWAPLSHSILKDLDGNPHTQYQLGSEKGAALGYLGLGSDALAITSQLGTGSATSSTFLRGDKTWQAVSTFSHDSLSGVAASTAHSNYQLLSAKAAASGYASLDSSTLVPLAQLGTGSATSSTFLRGDSTWQAVSTFSHDSLSGVAASTAHSNYQLLSGKGVANGYAGLESDGYVAATHLGSGVPTATKVLYGDGQWGSPTAASSILTLTYATSVLIDFNNLLAPYRVITLTGNLTLTTLNLLAGSQVSVILIASGGTWNLTFPGWKSLGASVPTTIASGKTAIMSLLSTGTTDAAVISAYSVEP